MATLQEGFDQSFAASLGPSRRIGRLRGRANALLAHLGSAKVPLRTLSPTASTSGNAERNSIADDLRSLIRDLSRVRRTDVLPPDLEMEAHEREAHGAAHGDGEGYELDMTDSREMEALENALDGMGGQANGRENGLLREEALLDALEQRLRAITDRAARL